MKKIFIFLAFNFIFILCFSQQDALLRNKKGLLILPEKGDIAVGIGVNSVFNYMGNLFSSSGNNQLNLSLLNNNQLYFKYFQDANKAWRMRLGVSIYDKNSIEDQRTSNESNTRIDLSFGQERRNEIGRIQLLYGAECGFEYLKFIQSYEYYNNNRVTIRYSGTTIGIRGFAGIEYFFLPKISIGGEVGLGIKKNLDGEQSINRLKVTNKSFEINTDILNGQISLIFHFNKYNLPGIRKT